MTDRGDLNRQSGFTLIEIAVVLAVVALLLGGLLVPMTAQIELQQTSETQNALDEISEALIGYAIINGRLPCPADGTIPAGKTNAAGVAAGQEYRSPVAGSPYDCANVVGNVAVGVLPWVTLGVKETDAWARRYTYEVTATWADSKDGTGSSGCSVANGVSFQLCSNANLNILSTVGGTSIASNVPAVVVSHGKNGFGAYTPSGARLSTSRDADEAENSNGDANFVSKPITPAFDDIEIWVSPSILMNLMVQAGRLP